MATVTTDDSNETFNGANGACTILSGAGAETVSAGSGECNDIIGSSDGDYHLGLVVLPGTSDLGWGGIATSANGVWYFQSGGNT